MDLKAFGQEFHRLRDGRGVTQEEVIERSRAYTDARTLRLIEGGEMRPKRPAVISLLVKGLEEHDGAVIDRFLDLADYELLRDKERIQHELTVRPVDPPPQPPAVPGFASIPEAMNPATLRRWKIAILACSTASLAVSASLKDLFLITTALLYAALYAISVLLESAYEFRREVTVSAALLSSSLIWFTSLVALWAETSSPTLDRLWVAIGIFASAATGQWLLVRPALSRVAVVPTRFQSMTGRSAHLKNTGYFLILVFSFWAIPVHCVASRKSGAGHGLVLCPPPSALWGLLVGYFAAGLYMAHTLLSKMRPGLHFDTYQSLFFARAILGLFLSVICLIWYSAALGG